MSIALYPHNQKAYENVLCLLEETGRAAVIHPTGTGKSFIAFKLAEEHPDNTLYCVSDFTQGNEKYPKFLLAFGFLSG